MGDIVADDEGHWYDQPLGGEMLGIPMGWSDIHARPLVQAWDSAGRLWGWWGTAQLPPGDSTELGAALQLWQSGRTVMDSDSLWIWRAATGVLERFPRSPGGHPEPTRRIRVAPMRPVQSHVVERSTITETGRYALANEPVTRVGGPIAVDADGRIFLILYGPNPPRAEDVTWPPEFLQVLSPAGTLLGMWALPTRNSRALGVRRSGEVLLLAHPSAADTDTWQPVRLNLPAGFTAVAGECPALH